VAIKSQMTFSFTRTYRWTGSLNTFTSSSCFFSLNIASPVSFHPFFFILYNSVHVLSIFFEGVDRWKRYLNKYFTTNQSASLMTAGERTCSIGLIVQYPLLRLKIRLQLPSEKEKHRCLLDFGCMSARSFSVFQMLGFLT